MQIQEESKKRITYYISMEASDNGGSIVDTLNKDVSISLMSCRTALEKMKTTLERFDINLLLCRGYSGEEFLVEKMLQVEQYEKVTIKEFMSNLCRKTIKVKDYENL